MVEVVDFKRRDPEADPPGGPFVIGSTVSLKSGGATMTVRKPGKKSVIVDWTNSSDDICSGDFPAAMLRHADPDETEKKEEAASGNG